MLRQRGGPLLGYESPDDANWRGLVKYRTLNDRTTDPEAKNLDEATDIFRTGLKRARKGHIRQAVPLIATAFLLDTRAIKFLHILPSRDRNVAQYYFLDMILLQNLIDLDGGSNFASQILMIYSAIRFAHLKDKTGHTRMVQALAISDRLVQAIQDDPTLESQSRGILGGCMKRTALHRVRSSLYMGLGNKKKAIQELSAALKLDPSLASVRCTRACIYASTAEGDIEFAAQEFRQFVTDCHPDSSELPVAYAWLAKLALGSPNVGTYEQAENYWGKSRKSARRFEKIYGEESASPVEIELTKFFESIQPSLMDGDDASEQSGSPEDDEAQLQACRICQASNNRAGGNLFRCGRCKQVSYCSPECQVKDWPKHCKTCKKKRKDVIDEVDDFLEESKYDHIIRDDRSSVSGRISETPTILRSNTSKSARSPHKYAGSSGQHRHTPLRRRQEEGSFRRVPLNSTTTDRRSNYRQGRDESNDRAVSPKHAREGIRSVRFAQSQTRSGEDAVQRQQTTPAGYGKNPTQSSFVGASGNAEVHSSHSHGGLTSQRQDRQPNASKNKPPDCRQNAANIRDGNNDFQVILPQAANGETGTDILLSEFEAIVKNRLDQSNSEARRKQRLPNVPSYLGQSYHATRRFGDMEGALNTEDGLKIEEKASSVEQGAPRHYTSLPPKYSSTQYVRPMRNLLSSVVRDSTYVTTLGVQPPKAHITTTPASSRDFRKGYRGYLPPSMMRRIDAARGSSSVPAVAAHRRHSTRGTDWPILMMSRMNKDRVHASRVDREQDAPRKPLSTLEGRELGNKRIRDYLIFRCENDGDNFSNWWHTMPVTKRTQLLNSITHSTIPTQPATLGQISYMLESGQPRYAARVLTDFSLQNLLSSCDCSERTCKLHGHRDQLLHDLHYYVMCWDIAESVDYKFCVSMVEQGVFPDDLNSPDNLLQFFETPEDSAELQVHKVVQIPISAPRPTIESARAMRDAGYLKEYVPFRYHLLRDSIRLSLFCLLFERFDNVEKPHHAPFPPLARIQGCEFCLRDCSSSESIVCSSCAGKWWCCKGCYEASEHVIVCPLQKSPAGIRFG